jgi:hypothetical protein
MAKLVLKNPNISAKEIARSLGYAEQKSIYYWLQKAGFKGMRDFRQAVLSRNGSNRYGVLDAGLARDRESRLPRNMGNYLAKHLGPGAYGILVSRDSGEVAKPGDMAVLDPDAPLGQGDLVAARIDGTTGILRRYELSGQAVYVDISSPDKVLFPDFVVGKVAAIVRKYV